ncbi:MAG: HlyC/CorC family transporter [SAR324 cluster bacterium]|nr:HlyC/CorC family transporter [SAR324 cluster bacterium]
MLWKILLILFFIFANGFFVAAEFALVKLRTSDVDLLVRSGVRSAILVERITHRLNAYLSACQLGVTLASLALGWVGEPLVADMLEPLFIYFGVPTTQTHFFALPIAFTLITFFHITAGEQIPKIMAIRKYQSAAVLVSVPLIIFYNIFRPFIWILNSSSNAILALMGFEPHGNHDQSTTEEEVRHILFHAAAGGSLKSREHDIMENVLDLEDKSARGYMVQRNEVDHLELDAPIAETLQKVNVSGHSRFPVCDGDLDNIIGIVHAKDILRLMISGGQLTSLQSIMREPMFFPETMHLDTLLIELQRKKILLALLVDEYGGFSGLITLENIIEELVGSIEDEFDDEKPRIVKKGADQFEVDADCSKEKVSKRCQVILPESISDSIGGVVIDLLRRIPKQGDKVIIGKHEFTVSDAKKTHINRVQIRKLTQQELENLEKSKRGDS